ncbi:MAG: 4-hydroxy-tetrahydrodipicolinate reductase [Candidatus Omnitrophica bacterium]|nr:4-hydroxy-tetrahydrodipicolinate reductase [Candidatus Omnitrophota bacterium]
MIKVGISGICGRMGRRIAAMCMEDPEVEISAGIESADSDSIGADIGEVLGTDRTGVMVTSDIDEACGKVDCIIEFTFPGPTLDHLEAARRAGVAIVIGTTAMDAGSEEKIRSAASDIPVVYSPNMSVGVNLLFKMIAEAAKALGAISDISIDETHHVHKKDSPSGTAKMMAKIVSDVVGKKVQVEAFREGEVVGNHGIIFDTPYETLEIRHDAKTRDVFVAGAIEAVKFVKGKAPGLYNMADVLGLK